MSRIFNTLAQWLMARAMRRPPDLEIGGPRDPYLRRWHLIPRNPLLNVYLHEFLRSDDDRALHDHPWVNLSWVLAGGYNEVVFARPASPGEALPPTRVRVRAAGDLVLRRARTAHRLVLGSDIVPCWSLFLTGPRLRDWGFWCESGQWVHWRLFTAGPRGELRGRGCE